MSGFYIALYLRQIQKLHNDLVIFQFQVRVSDSLGKSAVASVTINVIYDSPPVFNVLDTYNVTIDETLPLNDLVYRMTANDPDDVFGVSLHYVSHSNALTNRFLLEYDRILLKNKNLIFWLSSGDEAHGRR